MTPRPDDELLESYLEGELPPDEALALEARLKTEPQLAEQLVALARDEASLTEWARAMVVACRNGVPVGRESVPQYPATPLLPFPARRVVAGVAATIAVAATVLLAANLFFKSPPGPETVSLAKVEDIQGEVFIILSSGETRTAQAGDLLAAGQEVRTGEGSYASVRYPDETLIELSTDTRIRLLPDGGPEEPDTGKQLFVVEGVVNADVSKQPVSRPMILTTPHAVIRVLGTRFSSATLPESTRVELEQGKVQMIRKSDGQAVEVEEGRYAVARAKAEPPPAQVEPFATRPLPPRITQARAVLPYPAGPVTAVAISPNGRTLAASGWDGTVTLWDLDALEVRLVLKGHTKKVRSLSFSPDSKLLATGGEDRLIKVWEVEFGHERFTLSKQKLEVDAVAFSPDGRLLATGASQGKQRDGAQLLLWNAQTGEPIAHVPGHGAVMDLAFSPDGLTLATASKDGTVRLWDTAMWTERATLQGHHDAVYAVAFSPDGRQLASGGHDRAVILWDVEAQMPMRTIRGHNREVRVVAFSPDGLALATSAADGTARLWDLRNGQETATLKAHKFAVTGVAFSPDGKVLATCGWDRTVKVWDLGEPVAVLSPVE